MNKDVLLFIHEKDGEMGIILENSISMSMKDEEYRVELALTSKDPHATKCECHAGGVDEACNKKSPKVLPSFSRRTTAY